MTQPLQEFRLMIKAPHEGEFKQHRKSIRTDAEWLADAGDPVDTILTSLTHRALMIEEGLNPREYSGQDGESKKWARYKGAEWHIERRTISPWEEVARDPAHH